MRCIIEILVSFARHAAAADGEDAKADLVEAADAFQQLLACQSMRVCPHSFAAMSTSAAAVNWEQQCQASSLQVYVFM